MRDIIFFSMFVVMIPLSLRYVHLGVMLWVWSALLPPNGFIFGFARGIPFNKIAVACAVIGLVMDNRRNISLDPVLWLLLLFLGQVTLAQALGNTPPGWGGDLYERFYKVVLAALFIRFAAVDRLRLHSIIIAACLAVGTGAVIETGKFILSGGAHHVNGPRSWGDENITATLILLTMPLILYLRNFSAHPLFRAGVMSVFMTCALGVIGTFSRGGFIGLVVLLATLFLTARRRIAAFIAIGMIALIGYTLAPDSWFDRIQSTTEAKQDASFMGRVIQWKVLTLMALDHPLTGAGILSQFYRPNWDYYSGQLSYRLTFVDTPEPTTPYASHSIYFQVLGETGFPGLLLFLLVFGMAFQQAGVIRRNARDHPDQLWMADLAGAIRLGLLVYLITGAALPIPYFEAPYVLIASVSALRWIQRNPDKASASRTRTVSRRRPAPVSDDPPEIDATRETDRASPTPPARSGHHRPPGNEATRTPGSGPPHGKG